MSGFLKTQPPSTISHWQASNTGPRSLNNHGREAPLPESADVVIVGAGISGALLAYHLTHPENEDVALPEGHSILILEGSEVASSATGRNGGHFAPATFSSYVRLIKPFKDGGCGMSKKEAVEVLNAEWDNYIRNKEVIKKHNLEDKVDLWEGKVMTVYTEEKEVEEALADRQAWFDAMEECGGADYSDSTFIRGKEEARKYSRCTDAVGCSTRSAGSVHPHKLTTELLKLSLESTKYKVSLYTSTPLLHLHDSPNFDSISLETNRGFIKADKVILCTNAHTPHLFPENHALRKFIYPVRTQMGLITPAAAFTGVKSLETTYGFPGGYCATSTGGIVLGVGPYDYLAEGVGREDFYVCNSDDSVVEPECTEYLKALLPKTMEGWEEKAKGEGLMRTWTGVMGYTIDRLPLIGQVPDRPGLFIAAGFNGHGMSTTHTCGRALAKYLANGQWISDMPAHYRVTPKRLEHTVKEEELVKLVLGNGWRKLDQRSDWSKTA